MRLLIWVIWCVLGFCVLLGGCSAALRAEKLEACIEVELPGYQSGGAVEGYHDQRVGVDE